MKLLEFLNSASLYVTGKGLRKLDTLVLEATNYCNRNCFFCGAAQAIGERKKGYMEWDLFSRLVADAEQIRPKLVTLHAHGEPLLHPRLAEMVAELSARKLRTQIVTNGDLLTSTLSGQLLKSGLDQLVISHPGISEDNWQASRGEDSLEAADERIKEAVALWAASGKEVVIRCLMFPEHVKNKVIAIRQFIKQWVRQPGVTEVQFWLYQPWPDHILEDQILEINEDGRPCLLATNTVAVLWDGSITPCPYDHNGELSVGNGSQMGLVEADELLRGFRKNTIRLNKKRPGLCKKCIINRTPDLNAMVLAKDYLATREDDRDEWLDHNGRKCWKQLMGANI